MVASRCRSSTDHPVGGENKRTASNGTYGSIPTSLIVCACVFGGAVLGMFLRRVLPEDHLNADSKSTVNLGIGLIGTISGIALGLLVASAAGKYDTQKNELTKLSADFVLLDRVLAHYGSETKES